MGYRTRRPRAYPARVAAVLNRHACALAYRSTMAIAVGL